MKKLTKEVYLTVWIILNICLLSILSINFINNYYQEKNSIIDNLKNINRMKENCRGLENKKDVPPTKTDDNETSEFQKDENIIFMDYDVYTVLLDEDNGIKDIISHSSSNINEDVIVNTAQKILSSKNVQTMYVSNILFNKYSCAYQQGNSLTILDQSKIRKKLQNNLFIDVFIFMFGEILIIVISKKITLKITLPVKEDYLKQKQFVCDASHELKTPLAVIMASCDAALNNPEEIKWLNNIKSEADRMNYLITNLLKLAANDIEVKQDYKIEDLSKTVYLAALAFEGVFYEKKIKLDINITENIEMNMDVNSIKQLVEILLDNALSHANSSSTVELSLVNQKNEAILAVSNVGDVIPNGLEEKIFERFYRLDESRGRENNHYGLGLAIAKSIVLNHGGVITAKSIGNKTTFKVCFTNVTVNKKDENGTN